MQVDDEPFFSGPKIGSRLDMRYMNTKSYEREEGSSLLSTHVVIRLLRLAHENLIEFFLRQFFFHGTDLRKGSLLPY